MWSTNLTEDLTLSVKAEKKRCGQPPVEAKATLEAVVLPQPGFPTATTIGHAPAAFCHYNV